MQCAAEAVAEVAARSSLSLQCASLMIALPAVHRRLWNEELVVELAQAVVAAGNDCAACAGPCHADRAAAPAAAAGSGSAGSRSGNPGSGGRRRAARRHCSSGSSGEAAGLFLTHTRR